MTTIPQPANPKVEQILAGARQVFFEHGFGAATTDMVQQAAGVSKSTVYSYFPSKEVLFAAVIRAECEKLVDRVHGERLSAHTSRETLTRIGVRILETVLDPSILSLFRIIIAEAPRFPELGRVIFEAGASPMQSELARYLVEAGWRLELSVDDPDTAARHFVGMAMHDLQLRCLLGFRAPPDGEEIRRIVGIAVDDFLRAYARR